jgi:hypothetical protein
MAMIHQNTSVFTEHVWDGNLPFPHGRSYINFLQFPQLRLTIFLEAAEGMFCSYGPLSFIYMCIKIPSKDLILRQLSPVLTFTINPVYYFYPLLLWAAVA